MENVEGQCDLSGVTAYTLVSTHHGSSLISSDFAKACGFFVTRGRGFRDVRINGRNYKLEARTCYNLEVKVGGYRWLVSPILSFTAGYDLILGNDWLDRHYAMLDQEEKSVKFWPPGERPMRAMFCQKDGENVSPLTVVEVFYEREAYSRNEVAEIPSTGHVPPKLPSLNNPDIEPSSTLPEDEDDVEVEPTETFFGADNEEVDREFSYDYLNL